FDHNLHVHVAGLTRPQHRHTLGVQAEPAARLGARRDFDPRHGAVDGGRLEFAAERRCHHRHRYAAVQVGAVALEERVGADRQEDIEVAVGAPTCPHLALASETDPGAVLDPGRDVDRERALPRHAAGADATRAGILDHLAAPLARDASALEREEALRLPNAAEAAAGSAGLGFGAGLGTGAGAGLAGDRGRQPHLRVLAGERLFQADFHVVAQVRPALPARTTAAAPAGHAEQVVENVGKGRSKAGVETVLAGS